MAGVNNKPARSILVGRGRPAKPNGTSIVPGLGGAQIKGAGGGSPDGIGMSGDAMARLKQRLGVPIPLADLLAGRTSLGQAAAVDATSPAFDETGVKRYLDSNVLNTSYCTPVQRTGWVTFDNSLGPHNIPLGGEMSNDRIVVGLQQTFLIISFHAYAAMSNPGLPGAYVEIDPSSMIGQVAFFLQADNGEHPYPETTYAGSAPGNGTEFVNVPSITVSPAFSDTSTTSVRAVYNVTRSPFPGFPAIVGAKVRGYILPREAFMEALECADAGGCDR